MLSISNPNQKGLIRRLLIAVAALLAGIALVIYVRNPWQGKSTQPLTDIENIDVLRTQFNLDAGKVRLIIIGSPT